MPSLVAGYEYDIFISYRHNDNRSGWVTDFVAALQEELGSTIKYSVSIYFDKKPDDGLLESHNVDKSLEGKLKCLIFIPIISQTYCDLRSFAWEHEFRVFNRLSAEDQFGRHVKLMNGNVTSRILPVLIHDLDPDDRSEIEKEIGEMLRGIEFIYKEPGVNRPLKTSDNKNDSQNKTDYRNQINKVANAVKEVLVVLKSGSVQRRAQIETFEPKGRKTTTKKMVLAVVVLIFLAGGYFLFTTVLSINKDEPERSLAVLAFADMSPGKDQEWFSDGLSEEILNSLAHLPELKVTARTSSFYYKGKDVPLKEIAKTLGVANIVEGSVRRNGQQLRITAQLIRASDGFHIWSDTYDRTADDVFRVQREIAANIARKLLNQLSVEAKSSLRSPAVDNVEAYEYYLKGTWTHLHEYIETARLKDFEESERYLLKAISLDAAYANAYGALADLYDSRSYIVPGDESTYRKKRDSLIQIGLKLDPGSPQINNVNGWSFIKRSQPNLDSAYHYLKKAYRLYPNADYILLGLGGFYNTIGINEAEIEYLKGGSERDPLNVGFLNRLGFSYMRLGLYHDAKRYIEKALELDRSNLAANAFTALMAANQDKYDQLEAQIMIFQTLQEETAAWKPVEKQLQALSLAMQGKRSEALALAPRDLLVLARLKMEKEFLTQLDSIASLRINWIDPHGLIQDPVYDFVRNEAQFKDIVARVQRKYDSLIVRYPPPH